MTNKVKVLSLDPSQRNLGMAKLLIAPNGAIEVMDLELVETEKSDLKQVRKNSDQLRRAREQYEALKEWEAWADLVMSEIPTGSQSASAMFGNGICIGLLASIDKPLIQVQPTETKKASVGRATATKEEIIAWATKLYPDAPWKRLNDKPTGRIVDKNEHLADAIAVGWAGIRTAEFRAALSMLASLRRAA